MELHAELASIISSIIGQQLILKSDLARPVAHEHICSLANANFRSIAYSQTHLLACSSQSDLARSPQSSKKNWSKDEAKGGGDGECADRQRSHDLEIIVISTVAPRPPSEEVRTCI